MKPSTSLADHPAPAIQIPAGVATLAGFRVWVLSHDFPERWRASSIRGGIFIDTSPEEIDTHNMLSFPLNVTVFDPLFATLPGQTSTA